MEETLYREREYFFVVTAFEGRPRVPLTHHVAKLAKLRAIRAAKATVVEAQSTRVGRVWRSYEDFYVLLEWSNGRVWGCEKIGPFDDETDAVLAMERAIG